MFVFNGNHAHLAGVSLQYSGGTTYTFNLTQQGTQNNLDEGGVAAGKTQPGSVKVTLYAAWLNTLPAGSYTLHLSFDDGVVQSNGSAGLTLARGQGGGTTAQNNAAQAQPGPGSPQTGDNSSLPLWALCGGGATALALALGGAAYRRRRAQRKAG